MIRLITVLMSLFFVFTILGKVLLAGQISVINPSAGSEITGVANISPQSSGVQSGSSLSKSNNIGLPSKGGQKSPKYKVYNDFFKRMTFESFTVAQLLTVKSQLLKVLSNSRTEVEIKDLVKEQLDLVTQRLE